MKILSLVIVLTFFGIGISAAAESKGEIEIKTTVSKKSDVSADQFRCERMRGVKLAEFKEKLVTHCDLNKPFSFTSTDAVIDGSFMYCCQIKE